MSKCQIRSINCVLGGAWGFLGTVLSFDFSFPRKKSLRTTREKTQIILEGNKNKIDTQ